MATWLGAGIHDFVIDLFHIWKFVATAVISGLGAGVTAWHFGHDKGWREGNRAGRDKAWAESYHAQEPFHLTTPRPSSMPPAPPRRSVRRRTGGHTHYH